MRNSIRRTFSFLTALAVFALLSAFILAPTPPITAPAALTPAASNPAAYAPILKQGLSNRALQQGILGFAKHKAEQPQSKDILIVIDYSKSSNSERLYVLDMRDTTLVSQSLVAHGRNSGNEFATSFSNISGSYQSSLGFFRCAETYDGKHGLSLRLDGLERGINHLARERAIVIHKADYVDLDFAAEHGRIGRSLGCPALPLEGYEAMISTIKDGALLYIYGHDDEYAAHSAYLTQS